jgi:hypothetical protein
VWSSGQANPAAWGDTITKIKEGLLFAFDSAVSLREDDVKRSESQRQMPGWNFCTFFILKARRTVSCTIFDNTYALRFWRPVGEPRYLLRRCKPFRRYLTTIWRTRSVILPSPSREESILVRHTHLSDSQRRLSCPPFCRQEAIQRPYPRQHHFCV